MKKDGKMNVETMTNKELLEVASTYTMNPFQKQINAAVGELVKRAQKIITELQKPNTVVTP